jgi:acetolactate synthase I/III small subunit
MMLIKVNATSKTICDDVMRLTEIFRARVLDVSDKTYTIEVTGTVQKLDAFIDAVDTKSILEVVRSGITGIARGDRALSI